MMSESYEIIKRRNVIMWRHHALAVGLAGTLLAVTPALSVTLVNHDKSEHTFTVDQGAAQADRTIAAGASAEIACAEGCELRVRGSGYGRSVESDDKLVIDQGLMRFSSEDIVTGSIEPAASDTSDR